MELFEQLIGPQNLRSAWLRVRRNRGAPGTDGLTVGGFEGNWQQHLQQMAATLRHGRYKPAPLRTVDVPKDNGSGLRTLSIPTVQDRIVLQALVQVLTPLWEPTFSPYSFAYREGRGALDAVLLAQQRLQSGQHWIVDLDIEKFFDSVDQVGLMRQLAERIPDPQILDLIADFLRAGLKRDGVLYPTRQGIPQGSPLSPLLANIVLDELDQEYMRQGWSFVRYADDCILLAHGEAEARALLDFTREFLADRLHLHLNATKTRIVQPAEVGFLGFTYRLSRYGHVSRRVGPSALAQFQKRVNALAQCRRAEPFAQVVARVVEYARGWLQYFSFTQDETLSAARHFACDQLRGAAWALWCSPEERCRQLRRLGIAEDQASAAAFALRLPDQWPELDILRRAMPDAFFENFGLRVPPPPRPQAAESNRPLSQSVPGSACPSRASKPYPREENSCDSEAVCAPPPRPTLAASAAHPDSKPFPPLGRAVSEESLRRIILHRIALRLHLSPRLHSSDQPPVPATQPATTPPDVFPPGYPV